MRASTLTLSILLLLTIQTAGCTDPQSRRAAAIERGKSYLEERAFDKARVEFSTALQIEPEDADTIYLLGVTFERLGNADRALRSFHAALERDPDQIGARAELARIYAFGGFADEAVELLEEALPRHPREPQLLVSRALAYATLGDIDAASRDARIALAERPGLEKAVALQAGVLQKRGQRDEAIELLREGLRHNPDSTDLRVALAMVFAEGGAERLAIELLRETVALRPEDDAFRYQLARFEDEIGDPDAAEAVLRELVARRPEEIEPKRALLDFLVRRRGIEAAEAALREIADPDSEPELELVLADSYGALGNVERRRSLLEALAARDDAGPYTHAALTRLASAHLDEDRPAEAERLLERVLAGNPRDPVALSLRATIRLNEGRNAEAIIDVRSALSAEPDSPSLLNLLAAAYMRDGQGSLAREVLDDAISLAPGHYDTIMNLVQLDRAEGNEQGAAERLRNGFRAGTDLRIGFALAEHYTSAGEHEAAIAVYEDILAAAPESLPAANNLAMLLVTGIRDAASLERAREVSEPLADAGHPALLDTYGWVAYLNGDYEAAVSALARASSLAPGSATLAYHHGAALVASGETRAGRERLQAALALDAGFAEAEEARRVLGALEPAGTN